MRKPDDRGTLGGTFRHCNGAPYADTFVDPQCLEVRADGASVRVQRCRCDLPGGLRPHQSSASSVRVAARERSAALCRTRGLPAVLGRHQARRRRRSGTATGTVRERTATDHRTGDHQSGNARRRDRADFQAAAGLTQTARGARDVRPTGPDPLARADGRAGSSEVPRAGAAVVQARQSEAPRGASRSHHDEHPRHDDGRRRRPHARFRARRIGVPSAEDDRRVARRSTRGRMAHPEADERIVRRRRPGNAPRRGRSAVDVRDDQGSVRILRSNDARSAARDRPRISPRTSPTARSTANTCRSRN